MSASLPRSPWWIVAAGVLGWVLATALGALPDSGTFAGRLLHDACQTAGAVSLAAGAGGGLVLRWRRAEWRRRTQWVLADLLDRAQREVASIAARAVALSGGDASGRSHDHRLVSAFRPPWTARAGTLVASVVEDLRTEVLTKMEDGLAEDADGGLDQAALRAELEPHLDRLWATALELTSYVEEDEAPKLLTAVAQLHDEGRQLADPLFGHAVGGGWVLLSRLSASCVLSSATETAARLGALMAKLEREAPDPALRARLAAEREAAAEGVEEGLRMAAADREADRLIADIDRSVEDFGQSLRELAAAVQDLADDLPGDHPLHDAIAPWTEGDARSQAPRHAG